ncbi:MAG: deoxynucleoside kinase [Janthinobacterium lividum]
MPLSSLSPLSPSGGASVAAPLTVQPPTATPRFRHLVVEGPIGAGKTQLAQRLADRWSMTADLEQPGDNPFLERFYRDDARYALPVQLDFLLRRAAQMQRIQQTLAQGTAVASDFLPQRSELFARLTLPPDEFELYRTLATRVDTPPAAPDLVVFLQASAETLFARIQRRAMAIELQIPDAYLRALSDAYDAFFYHYDGAPLLTVNTEHLDPIEHEADFALLVERIEGMRGRKESFVKGTQ